MRAPPSFLRLPRRPVRERTGPFEFYEDSLGNRDGRSKLYDGPFGY